MRTVPPVSPGEMLDEEFLKPLGLTKYRLAKDIGVPPQLIGDIVAGKGTITADTDLRLCRYFGVSDGWWLLSISLASANGATFRKSGLTMPSSASASSSRCKRCRYDTFHDSGWRYRYAS